jgi:hypothetical protein
MLSVGAGIDASPIQHLGLGWLRVGWMVDRFHAREYFRQLGVVRANVFGQLRLGVCGSGDQN